MNYEEPRISRTRVSFLVMGKLDELGYNVIVPSLGKHMRQQTDELAVRVKSGIPSPWPLRTWGRGGRT